MRIVRSLCWLYLALLSVAVIVDLVIALTTQYGDRAGTGCSLYDAMVVGIECRGFAGSKLLQHFLNWPLLLVYVPMFAFSSLWLLFPAILLWLPVAFLLVSRLRRRYVA